MNYGGIDAYPKKRPQSPWKKVFLWKPTRIDGHWYWLRNVHQRWRMDYQAKDDAIGANIITQYEYAVDVFDLIKKDAE